MRRPEIIIKNKEKQSLKKWKKENGAFGRLLFFFCWFLVRCLIFLFSFFNYFYLTEVDCLFKNRGTNDFFSVLLKVCLIILVFYIFFLWFSDGFFPHFILFLHLFFCFLSWFSSHLFIFCVRLSDIFW